MQKKRGGKDVIRAPQIRLLFAGIPFLGSLCARGRNALGKIEVAEIVSAQFSVGDFAMDYGEVLHDYNVKK